MNQAVIDKARELAAVLAKSPEYLSMRAAEEAAAKDDAIADAFGRYNDLHQQIERISMQETPDFDKMGELTREMESVQEQIQEMPLAKAMQRARGLFTELMQQVNIELSQVLNPNAGGSCSGNCGSCGGCHH